MHAEFTTPPSKAKLDEYVKLGLVRSQSNPTGQLTIYVYTPFTQYEGLWNNVTRQARGLVLDSSGRAVVRCVAKFFNSDEPWAPHPADRALHAPVVQEKLDGSLIQVANDPDYGLVVTSKASFASDQAVWGREIISESYSPDDFEPGLTYVFELIHPENRIVIEYGARRELVLLAIIDNETGVERNIYHQRFDRFNSVPRLNESLIFDVDALNDGRLAEGVVANFGGRRVKYKTSEYVRLHRIVANFTPKRVWEALSNGDSLEFENMPEEFQTWLDDTVTALEAAYEAVEIDVKGEFDRAAALTDKDLGLSDGYTYKGLVFMLRNGKDVSPSIWKIIKPKREEGDA